MLFHPDDFRLAVSDSNNKGILSILTKLIHTLHHHTELLYLVRMTEEVSGILKSQSESPILKFKTAKMLMYLIVLGDPQVIQLFSDEIFPLIRNTCLYNRFHPLLTRGMDFFRTNKYYEVATFDEKTKIKNIGCRYIIFCLECIYILGQWLPKDQTTNKESVFLSSYKMLLKEGVQFPKANELSFFSEDRISKIEEELKLCHAQAEKFKEDADDDYFENGRNRFDASVMNGVEYLQKKLKEKEKLISEMKYNNSVNEFQKQSIMVKLQEQESSHGVRVEVYEKKIAVLTEQVREMKQLIKAQQRRSPERESKQKEIIANLQAQLQLLNYQNSQLKEELAKKSSIMENYGNLSQNHTMPSPNGKSQKYIKELLEMCEEQEEYSPKKTKKSKEQKQAFFDVKDPKAPFLPFYDLLTQQMQIRFRKCLLKSKEILFKNKQIQIGIISSLKNDIEIQMTLIITNLSDKLVLIQDISFHFVKELPVVKNESTGKKKLKGGEQIKQDIKVIVNSIDGRCPTLIIQYQQEEHQTEEISLILPISKLKLMQTLPFTSHSLKEWQHTQRVIVIQKRILSNSSKLKDYWPRCFIEKHNENKEYCFKVKLLQTLFFLRLTPIGDQSLMIKISYSGDTKCLSDKLLNELLFILSK